MASKIYAFREIESDGYWAKNDKSLTLQKWSFVKMTLLDSDKVDIKKDGNNPPERIILTQGVLILEYT